RRPGSVDTTYPAGPAHSQGLSILESSQTAVRVPVVAELADSCQAASLLGLPPLDRAGGVRQHPALAFLVSLSVAPLLTAPSILRHGRGRLDVLRVRRGSLPQPPGKPCTPTAPPNPWAKPRRQVPADD